MASLFVSWLAGCGPEMDRGDRIADGGGSDGAVVVADAGAGGASVAPTSFYRRIKVEGRDHLFLAPPQAARVSSAPESTQAQAVDSIDVSSSGDFGPYCDVLAVSPAVRAGGRTPEVRTVRELIRDVTYSAYQWRSVDGAQVKLYREVADRPTPFGRPRLWLVVAGSVPAMFSGNINDLNENAFSQSILLAPQSSFVRMVKAALEDALSQNLIPANSDLLFTGHSQGGNIATNLSVLLEPAAYGIAPSNQLHSAPFARLGEALRAKGVRLLGGLSVAHRRDDAVEARAAANAHRFGHFFPRVVVEGDIVPYLGTNEWAAARQEFDWLNPSESIAEQIRPTINLGKLLVGAALGRTVPGALSGEERWGRNTIYFFDRTPRGYAGLARRDGVDRHGQSYIDAFNDSRHSLAIAPRFVCQPDVIRVTATEVASGRLLIDVTRNDYLPGPGTVAEAGVVLPSAAPATKINPFGCGRGSLGAVVNADGACVDPAGWSKLQVASSVTGQLLALELRNATGGSVADAIAGSVPFQGLALSTTYRVTGRDMVSQVHGACQGTVLVQIVPDDTPPEALSHKRVEASGAVWVPAFNLAFRPISGSNAGTAVGPRIHPPASAALLPGGDDPSAYPSHALKVLHEEQGIFPSEAPLVAYAPGWSDDLALRADDDVTFRFELVVGYAADCFSAPDFRPQKSKILCLATEGNAPLSNPLVECAIGDPGMPMWGVPVADVCDVKNARLFRHEGRNETRILRQNVPELSCKHDPERKNRVPDGVPDVLWVPWRDGTSPIWGTVDAEEAVRRPRPDWAGIEDAVLAWSERGCPDADPMSDVLIAYNRSMPICANAKAPLCPDGEPASVRRLPAGAMAAPEKQVPGHRELEYVCPVVADGQVHALSVGKDLSLDLPFSLVGDDDWVVNAWVAGATNPATVQNGLDVGFEYPDVCTGTDAMKCGQRPGYCQSAQRREPFDPFPHVRRNQPKDALPTLRVSARSPGEYEVRLLLRNASKARRVARFRVRVGQWRGLWRTETWAYSTSGGTGSFACDAKLPDKTGPYFSSHLVGFKVVDLGTGEAPIAVTPGTYVNIGITPCTKELLQSVVESTPITGLYAEARVAYDTVYNGDRSSRSVGRMQCTGFDHGPGSPWEMCAAMNQPTTEHRCTFEKCPQL